MSSEVLPRRIFIVTTHMLDHDADVRSLFRPCEFSGRWRTDLPEARRFNDFDADLAQQLRSAGPHFSAEVHQTVAECCPDLRTVAVSYLGRPAELTLTTVSFGLTDVGHGSVTLEYAVAAAEQPGVEVTDLGVITHLQDNIDALVADYITEVRMPGQDGPASATCLWGHILYDLEGVPDRLLEVLAPDTRDDSADVRLRIRSALVKPGLGSSVTAGADRMTTDKVARVLALISAYYAAAAELDRLIFAELQARRLELDRERPLRSAPGELVYDRLFEDVSLFQAILATLDLHLAASTATEVRIWAKFSRAWQLGLQLEALTEKLTLLRTFQEREAARVAVHRSGRFAVIAVVFTVLNFVSTLLDLIDFGQGKGLSRPDDVRSLVSLALTAGVVLIFAYWARRPLPPP